MTLSVGTRLGPYEILAPLGAGGMGEVYRARDTKLKRDVAIKVLPQSLAGDSEALARFEREALAVAALSHPNILAIFDSGADGGTAYAVMELLEGETLRGRLDAGALAQKQAVEYALQIARGLSAAHERGVVHRDLKPENLFLSKDGHLKILDFGLAKKSEPVAPGEETSAPTASGHTQPGTVMGTVGYMSPEQVRGQPVDHRSDIFSFGTILYELLSGRRAFKKDTAADTMAAILKEEPRELSESGTNVSPALDHVVSHCLEKDRDRRFQSVRDIAFALSEASGPAVTSVLPLPRPSGAFLAVVAAVVVLAAAGVFVIRRSRDVATEAAGVKRVAVLPFENVGAAEDDYFADGMADEIRSRLTSLRGVEVIARASSIPYKKTTKSPKQIAQELGAAYLLTATVRWQKTAGANRVHVTPELVEVKDSGVPASRWGQAFDSTLTDVFQVQSDVATRVAEALRGALGAGEEKRLSEKPTQNLAAYDAFLKGEEASKGVAYLDPASRRKALAYYEQAVALDPGFAQAWASVADVCLSLYTTSGPALDLAERGRRAAEKAVALAPGRAEGYLALGRYADWVVGDSNRAMEQYLKAQRLAPGNADILGLVALKETSLGRWDVALEHFRQAERLDPRSAEIPAGLGQALVMLRRYPEAREALDRGLALAPTDLNLIEWKAMVFLAQGDLDQARAVLRATPKVIEPTALVAQMATIFDLMWVLDEDQRELLLRLTPSAFGDDRGFWGLCLAQAYALRGDTANVRTYAEEARKTIEEQLGSTRGTASPDWIGQYRVNLGLALAYLGRKEEAMREGERALEADPNPYYRHQLVRIYIILGEQDKALDQLEPLLKIPYWLSPAWLKIDPNFDPLRKNLRFQKLVAGG